MDHTGMQHKGDIDRKPCITVHPAEVAPKLSTNKSPPRKAVDVQDADKLSDPVAIGPCLED